MAIFILFSNCASQTQKCEHSLWVPFDRTPVAFNKFLWDRFLNLPDEAYDSSYYYLAMRERMICDLTLNILSQKLSYDFVDSLIGPGVEAHYVSSTFPYGLPYDSLKTKLLSKEIMIVIAGYNASGDNRLIVEFKNGYYLKCSRAEAQ